MEGFRAGPSFLGPGLQVVFRAFLMIHRKTTLGSYWACPGSEGPVGPPGPHDNPVRFMESLLQATHVRLANTGGGRLSLYEIFHK